MTIRVEQNGFQYSTHSAALIDEHGVLSWSSDPAEQGIQIFPETEEARAAIIAQLKKWGYKILN